MMEDMLLYGFHGGHWVLANGKCAAVLWVAAMVVCILIWLFDKWRRYNGLE